MNNSDWLQKDFKEEVLKDFKESFLKIIKNTKSNHEYEFIKNAYFEKRAYEINDGNVVDFIGE